MDRWQSFQSFFQNPSVEVSVGAFVVNLTLAALLSYLLSLVYVRCARALSNRRAFAANFVLITTTTTLIITIVKSSLALSLGLVGALSIVRFRAAIKEPEELAYLFLAIAIGLGFGADQRLVTVAAFTGIIGLLLLRHRLWRDSAQPHLHLTVTSRDLAALPLEGIVRILEEHCTDVNLRRFDEEGTSLEASFAVEFESFAQLAAARTALVAAHENVGVTFLDSRGVL